MGILLNDPIITQNVPRCADVYDRVKKVLLVIMSCHVMSCHNLSFQSLTQPFSYNFDVEAGWGWFGLVGAGLGWLELPISDGKG